MNDDIEALVQLVPELRGRKICITQLSGGITNRNYLVDVDGARYVMRVGGNNTALLGINRRHEYICSTRAAGRWVGTEVVAFLPDHNAMLFRFAPGRVLTPSDVRQPAVLQRIVESLRRYHQGPASPGLFSPFSTVSTYRALALQHGVTFPSTMDTALTALSRIQQAVQTDAEFCPCHNDLLAANLIDDGTQVRIIDWEYAGMGDVFFDLGNLAINNEFSGEHEELLLLLYFGCVTPENLRHLRLMELASDMREALWGFLQSGISTLDVDFLTYGNTHLERFLARYTALAPSLLTPAIPPVPECPR